MADAAIGRGACLGEDVQLLVDVPAFTFYQSFPMEVFINRKKNGSIAGGGEV